MTMTHLITARAATSDDPGALASAFGPAWSDSFHAMQQAGLEASVQERALDARALREFDVIWRAMREASPLVMARALWELGWLRSDHEVLTVETIAEQSCSSAKYRPLISQWLEVLNDHGVPVAARDLVERDVASDVRFERGAAEPPFAHRDHLAHCARVSPRIFRASAAVF